jgi:hypothetical protein
MSLASVLIEKTQKARNEFLSNYLNRENTGALPEEEEIHFKHIFEIYYTPDDKDIKFNVKDISSVNIMKNKYGVKCFCICVNNQWYPTSIKRLSGSSKRTQNAILRRALRNAIEEQINDYRILHPLNVNDICPVTKNTLGFDAQVDHYKPFHILADEWLQNNKHMPNPEYNREKLNYILQEPYLQSWLNYHLDNAKLRWVSKEGNKIAHKI